MPATKSLAELSENNSILPKFSKTPKNFNTNILVVGGSYAGLSTIRALQVNLTNKIKEYIKAEPLKKKITITLIEPRNGFLNILGIPKCIVDLEFAKTQYIPFNKLDHLRFNHIISNNSDTNFDDSWYVSENKEEISKNIEINFIHGECTFLDTSIAKYKLNTNEIDVEDTKIENLMGEVEFDYVVMASGRDRNWPTTPKSQTNDIYLEEMSKAYKKISNAETISVIGAGAVGIEIAGDIKTKFPNKCINLIHPHDYFPNEPLSIEFKSMIQDSIERNGINIYLNTRIQKENDQEITEGNLKTTTNKTIESNLNIWCNSKYNNLQYLSNSLKNQFITEDNQIKINDYLQLDNSILTIPNFFVLGDLVNLPIIKSAGWALFFGRQTASNITSLIFENKVVEPLPDLSKMPRGMVLVGGNDEIISELAGDVSLNHEGYKKEYLDYCIGKVRATLDL
ncbi:uncharacterized protein KGF55_001008 [Candida pseudojiufengensis]|uniref:uncharacterized protein n=1 Tax=Candida pseudojiufengensis TaxID=497109 RepID=UPI002224F5E6|nr:uncharacterized protein KGF55_001008 [Candida pseudojiufengensis]KAI5965646.1 hypothetical protein KGF55_001008 [Candida pseudojiufengensis]